MNGGFNGIGIKTAIPHTASAKIACRLVPGQEPEGVFNKVKAHVADLGNKRFAYANISLSQLGGGSSSWTTPRHTKGNKAAARAIEVVMGTKPFYHR